jgi:hypothetical protein
MRGRVRQSWLPARVILALSLLMASLGLPATGAAPKAHAGDERGLAIHWADNFLTVRGTKLPGGEVKIWYLEAYCRPGSSDRDWGQTVIGHKTELISADDRQIKVRCTLNDGVVVDHTITAAADEVDFRLAAHNPTGQASQAHWAQPCVRVDKFTGKPFTSTGQEDYLAKCFVFVEGKLQRMPLANWATRARYVPGQVWCPKHVDRNDVNPRPLSDVIPSNGLIGCFSADESMILATAWEPYQELFQGVVVCLHSDFRLGGLKPGETKNVRGKLYIVPADVDALLTRYEHDFPEHVAKK